MRAASIVVFSHLRWDSVFQRPHHLMTRMAREQKIFFIEEPRRDPHGTRLEWREVDGNIAVCMPHTRLDEAGFTAAQMQIIAPLLREQLAGRAAQPSVTWIYTPMALPLAREIPRATLVYDCMDELSGFLYAPPALQQREAELLGLADLVFTGGPSLYRAKRNANPNVHCFPSSVDAEHFQRATFIAEADDQHGLPRPRLGFYGVIDERIDYPLLDALATARPSWQIVMVGPVVKVDPASLPRHPNLHYLGARSYDALPRYLAGWDVCLLPFARNRATQFISPTKTLEYMAAERPIVSTPIRDVAEPYGDIVSLAGNAEQFIAACDRALHETVRTREARCNAMRCVVASTSWDRTVAEMAELIDQIQFNNYALPTTGAAVAAFKESIRE